MATTPVSESGFFTELYNDLPITKEATTSRVIVNNRVLRHVLFSFDAGQVLTEHASTRAVIVNILEGDMKFRIGDKETVLHTGDVVYLAPNDRHALEAVSPCRMSLTLVDVAETAAAEGEGCGCGCGCKDE